MAESWHDPRAYQQVLAIFSEIEPVGEIEWTRSNRHTGLRHFQVRVSRARRKPPLQREVQA